jgi:hypothetical protein
MIDYNGKIFRPIENTEMGKHQAKQFFCTNKLETF